MPNILMMIYVGVDVLFAACGGLLMGFCLMAEQTLRANPSAGNVGPNVLLRQCPLTAGVVNAIFIFVTFLLSLPAFFLPHNRGWLRAQGWLVIFCAIFTLGLGLSLWVDTLQTRKNLLAIWSREPDDIKSLLQGKFDCCGYFNATSPPFVRDATCSTDIVALQKGGCIAEFAKFANSYLDVIFTACFGMVGVDMLLVLCVAMVLKYRQEQERYRAIDQKNADGS